MYVLIRGRRTALCVSEAYQTTRGKIKCNAKIKGWSTPIVLPKRQSSPIRYLQSLLLAKYVTPRAAEGYPMLETCTDAEMRATA